MSNRGGNGGYTHGGAQPNHTSRNFGPSRAPNINHQPRHIIPPNNPNMPQSVLNVGSGFHPYINQQGLVHSIPQVPQNRYPNQNHHQHHQHQHQSIGYQSYVPVFFQTMPHGLHGSQFSAIAARSMPGAPANPSYNMSQGMVPPADNPLYVSDQYFQTASTPELNSVTPSMPHVPPPNIVHPNKNIHSSKREKRIATFTDPCTGKVLDPEYLASPLETKPHESSKPNATTATREDASSTPDDRSQKTQEFMDGITKAATAPLLKDKSNNSEKTGNKHAPEANRKGVTLTNDTYSQSNNETPSVQKEMSEENLETMKPIETSSDLSKLKLKDSALAKDDHVRTSQEISALDICDQKKTSKSAKASETTDQAIKSSISDSAKAGSDKKVKEQLNDLDVRIESDQLKISTDVIPEPNKDSNNSNNGSTATLSSKPTVIEGKPELTPAEPTQLSPISKDIPNSNVLSPSFETKDTPSDETRQTVSSDVVDHASVMTREESLSPHDDISQSKEISEASIDEVSSIETTEENKENDKPALEHPKVNSKGKYEYKAEFLRSLQSHPLSLQKPDLPDLDIVQQVPIPQREKQTNRINDFLPSYMAPSRSGNNRSLPPRISGRNSRELRPSKPPIKIIPSPSLSQDVSLHTVENAWKPAIPALKPAEDIDEEEKNSVELYKKFRGILNKLTPQKYDDLIKKVDALSIDTADRLKKVLNLIFEKAVDEPAFCTDYAKLCKHIATGDKAKKPTDELDKASDKDDKAKEKQFRQLLLSRCQTEFESDIYKDINIEDYQKKIDSESDPEKKRILKLELDEEKRKARKRSLGINKFIGELYMFDMLRPVIMDSCISQLLQQKDDDSLECLCTLLRTVGAKWENDSAKRPNQSKILFCIGALGEIVQKRLTSSRVRFMIQDVLDMRRNGWKVRKIQAENKPKTIEQLHAEIQQEEQVKKHEIQQHIIKTGDTRKVPTKQDEWNSQRNNRSNTPNVLAQLENLKKLTANSASQGDNVSLQPQRGLWGSGASLGAGMSSAQRSQNSDIFGRSSLNENNKNKSRTSGNTMGRDSMEGQSSFRPFSSLEGEAHSSYPGRASTGSRLPSTVAPFASTSDSSVKKETSSRSNSMEKSGLSDSRASSSSSSNTNLVRESPKKEVVQGIKFRGDKDLSDVKVAEKATNCIKEFMLHGMKLDAKEDLLDLCTEKNVHVYVETAINLSLDLSSHEKRLLIGDLLGYLVKEKVIKQEQFCKGLHSILENASDMLIDIPKLWSNLADTLVPTFCSIDDSNRRKFFNKALEPCKDEDKGGAALIMYHILNFKKNNPKSTYDCASAWVTGGLDWSSFLPSTEKTAEEFFKKNDLTLPVLDLQLKCDLMSNCAKIHNPNQLEEYINKHFTPDEVSEPKFLRALTQAIVTKCVVPGPSKASHKLNFKKFAEYCLILAKFHKNKKPLELEIIFAIQILLADYENPKGLLLDLFEQLRKKASISDQAFIDWEADQSHVKNKGPAVHMVKDFLTKVKEGGSGSDS